MKYRHLELLGLKTISADGTEPLDIDLSDPISRIIIDLRVTNGAGGDADGHPLEAVTNIELVDGSELLFGLTGMCTQALDIYCSGEFPRGGWFNYLPTTDTEIHVAIDFGRFLFDPLLALDPKQFRNLQLKVTHDISAGGMNPSQCKLAIYAEVFDEKIITPVGFLMSKEIKTWSGTSGSHEYTDLPVDFPYRKLLIQGLKRGSPPNWVLDLIKLSEDQDKKVVLNDHFRDIMFGMGRKNAFIRELLTSTGVASKRTNYCTPSMDVMGIANQWRNDTDGGDVATYNGDGGQYEFYCELAQNTVHHISGWAPHGVLCIPFGDQMDIDDWYDVSNIGSLKLDVKDGQSTTTSKVFIQQLRSY
ncbi:hypothetical protein LCGC14_2407940 [marine sediment metagenome]|uniref:Uncharacterized protein n=1 Tax=marine sediment metagenome TaxID=412755 RepID=A0A0F9E5H7_9ZZZZ